LCNFVEPKYVYGCEYIYLSREFCSCGYCVGFREDREEDAEIQRAEAEIDSEGEDSEVSLEVSPTVDSPWYSHFSESSDN
jgi:hypothetical protein